MLANAVCCCLPKRESLLGDIVVADATLPAEIILAFVQASDVAAALIGSGAACGGGPRGVTAASPQPTRQRRGPAPRRRSHRWSALDGNRTPRLRPACLPSVLPRLPVIGPRRFRRSVAIRQQLSLSR